jgi:hypothetical protein
MKRNSKRLRRSGDGGLSDVTAMDWNLVVCSNQIDLEKKQQPESS